MTNLSWLSRAQLCESMGSGSPTFVRKAGARTTIAPLTPYVRFPRTVNAAPPIPNVRFTSTRDAALCLKCANNGHCAAACRRTQFDPLRTLVDAMKVEMRANSRHTWKRKLSDIETSQFT
jgi:hypothetical protein